jgi:alpha-glucoside transport system permease protein
MAGMVFLLAQFAIPRPMNLNTYDGDKLRQQTRPWVFVFPALFVLGLFLVYPAIYTFFLSLMNRDASSFVGLENYIWAFENPKVQESIRNNILWLILVPGLSTAFGLVIAVLADRVRWESFAKALIFLPMAISFVGASVIWRFIYFRDPSIGLLNAITTSLGGEPVPWLITTPWNNFALIIVMVWIQTGFAMVLLSSALKAVPEETIEAARIDGASEVRIFFSILIPQIMSTIAVVVTTILILVLKVFDIVFVMTSGQYGTEVLANRMIALLRNGEFHQSSTVAMIIMLAVIPIMYINVRRFQEEEELR